MENYFEKVGEKTSEFNLYYFRFNMEQDLFYIFMLEPLSRQSHLLL